MLRVWSIVIVLVVPMLSHLRDWGSSMVVIWRGWPVEPAHDVSLMNVLMQLIECEG